VALEAVSREIDPKEVASVEDAQLVAKAEVEEDLAATEVAPEGHLTMANNVVAKDFKEVDLEDHLEVIEADPEEVVP